jgi:hypothetical protein
MGLELCGGGLGGGVKRGGLERSAGLESLIYLSFCLFIAGLGMHLVSDMKYD